jgi:hypothetical protein
MVVAWHFNYVFLSDVAPCNATSTTFLKFNRNVTGVDFIELAQAPTIMVWAGPEIRLCTLRDTDAQPLVIMRHDGSVKSAVYLDQSTSPKILSWSADCTVRLWDAQTGAEIARFTFPEPPSWLELLPRESEGSITVAASFGDGTMGILDFCST